MGSRFQVCVTRLFQFPEVILIAPRPRSFLSRGVSALIPFGWEVPGVFRSRLGDRAGRQRIMTADGHLLIVLHKVPQPGTTQREPAIFWRNPRGDWLATEGLTGLGALHAHFERWRSAIDEIEDQMQGAP